jgi:hypothetical protein
MEKTTRAEYLKLFKGHAHQKEALGHALDIRKFEIELYWKRASYFWAFIAATFAGYFILQKDQTGPFESSYIVACLGFTFSVAWYFVNRGSKVWQRNWETQVDLLEDEIMGPLYKIGVNRYTYSFVNVEGGYPFSPTNINHILGLFVTSIWLYLLLRLLVDSIRQHQRLSWTTIGVSVITVCTVLLFLTKGRTRQSIHVIPIELGVRTYSDE